jgi:hypothetical protein
MYPEYMEKMKTMPTATMPAEASSGAATQQTPAKPAAAPPPANGTPSR